MVRKSLSLTTNHNMRGKTMIELKLYLKIIVDKNAKKVVFAEAGKDFVDFIFHIMTLPLASVVKLLNDKGMSGCLWSVYLSVDTLDHDYFQLNVDKNSVLKPENSSNVSLFSFKNCWLTSILLKPLSRDRFNLQRSPSCSEYNCSRGKTVKNFSHLNTTLVNVSPGFVKANVAYMVMDDLTVKPMSISVMTNQVTDFDYYEEKVVEFGAKEAVEMLKASLETNSVLTTVFLGTRN